MSFVVVALWGAFIAGAVFYTQEARHPATRPLAAYLIFVTLFSVVALAIFGGLTAVLDGLQATHLLAEPVPAALFLAAVFLPAFFVGRWQVKKPPGPPRYPTASQRGE